VPLLIQQNVDGSNFFNRSWAEFKVGFNDNRGNYWLGNEQLHQLTHSGRYKLRFDLQSRPNLTWYYAEYSSCVISSEASNYRIQVSGYSGNAGDPFAGYHNGMMFSTYDHDNDQHELDHIHCAALHGSGFWFNACAYCNVNSARRDFFRWRSGFLLQSTRMWLMC